MLTVGDRFPDYELQAVVSDDLETAFRTFRSATHQGKWRVIFFYPKDFTFVCPTEIVGFARLAKKFEERDAVVMGASTDSEFVHLAWRQHHADLRDLAIPLLADTSRRLSEQLGILEPAEKVCRRATFVVDPEGVIRHVSVNDGKVGRSPEETLRILDALQTDELCPCNWKPGADVIRIG